MQTPAKDPIFADSLGMNTTDTIFSRPHQAAATPHIHIQGHLTNSLKQSRGIK